MAQTVCVSQEERVVPGDEAVGKVFPEEIGPTRNMVGGRYSRGERVRALLDQPEEAGNGE